MLLTRKSSKSRNEPPNTPSQSNDQKLNPSTHGIESNATRIILTILDFFLLNPVSSIQHDTIFSNTASTVEKAANVINTKNKLPQTLPKGMLLKIFGNVIKTRLGPCV